MWQQNVWPTPPSWSHEPEREPGPQLLDVMIGDSCGVVPCGCRLRRVGMFTVRSWTGPRYSHRQVVVAKCMILSLCGTNECELRQWYLHLERTEPPVLHDLFYMVNGPVTYDPFHAILERSFDPARNLYLVGQRHRHLPRERGRRPVNFGHMHKHPWP